MTDNRERLDEIESGPLMTPVRLGSLSMANRIVMAPMTRSRALAGALIQPSAVRYYSQRSSAGLIVSEGSAISAMGIGGPGIPGIWNDDQVEAWRPVTDEVHRKGGLIVLQLWHVGRASHPSLLPEGEHPVGPSTEPIKGQIFSTGGLVDHVTPRQLSEDEIEEIIAQYARSAQLSIQAGFDGVEVHGANGYLPDQFLHASSNSRTDAWGGSIERQVRFPVEVTKAVVDAVGSDRTGIRIAPSSSFNDMADPERPSLFEALLTQLNDLSLAYLHVVEPGISGAETSMPGSSDRLDTSWVRSIYHGPVISAGDHTRDSAERVLAAGSADAVAFGRLFISNPDLPTRLHSSAPLTDPDRATFYGGDDRGYLDYPALSTTKSEE